MNRFVRAGGVAAAVTFALSFASGPSTAGEVETAVTASYLDHAAAEIDHETTQELAQAAGDVVAFAQKTAPRPRSLPEMVQQLASAEVPEVWLEAEDPNNTVAADTSFDSSPE